MALDLNLAGMFLNDAVGYGEAEAGAASLPLSRSVLRSEEGIVNALDILGCDARSGIRDRDAHAIAIRGGNTQRAAACHGVLRVQKQVQKTCLNLPGFPSI